ncbi:protein FAM43B [Emydura macquarii macquarii]|uniref:protein FAM43B n=1 Tax=Emydura macquarii macquarii TaxID=1129001 RepID=UPI00352A7386
MLPWRRSKFVLVEDERKGKGKSLGPGLSYTSLLCSFVRSCPDLLPEWPLERLGSVFRSKRQTVELNPEDPTYTAWYLGNAVTLQAKGEGCTDGAVGKIWAKSDGGASGAKMKLTLGPQGLRLAPGEKGGRRPGHVYLLHRITCCVADGRHPKVFAWVYRHQVRNKAVVLRCHAVLLSKAEKARAVARRLGQTASAAFHEFKRLQRQNDGRRLQQQRLGPAVLPRVPLRRLLNAKCPYRPPADRSRGARRLSSIQEEEEEEEEQGPSCRVSPASSRHPGPGGSDTPGSGCSHPPPASKAAEPWGRAEVLTLVGEMRVCSLRGPLPQAEIPPWKPSRERACLSC